MICLYGYIMLSLYLPISMVISCYLSINLSPWQFHVDSLSTYPMTIPCCSSIYLSLRLYHVVSLYISTAILCCLSIYISLWLHHLVSLYICLSLWLIYHVVFQSTYLYGDPCVSSCKVTCFKDSQT
jgi:hypothetical protein